MDEKDPNLIYFEKIRRRAASAVLLFAKVVREIVYTSPARRKHCSPTTKQIHFEEIKNHMSPKQMYFMVIQTFYIDIQHNISKVMLIKQHSQGSLQPRPLPTHPYITSYNINRGMRPLTNTSTTIVQPWQQWRGTHMPHTADHTKHTCIIIAFDMCLPGVSHAIPNPLVQVDTSMHRVACQSRANTIRTKRKSRAQKLKQIKLIQNV